MLQTTLTSSLNRFAYLFTPANSLSDVLNSRILSAVSTLVISGSSSSISEYPLLLNQAGSKGPTVLIDRLLPSSSPHVVAHYARLIARAAFHAQGRFPGSVHRVLVHQESANQFLAALQQEVRSTFGAGGKKGARRDGAVPRNEKEQFKQLLSLVKEKAQGKILIGGGEKGSSTDSVSPTVVTEPTLYVPSLASPPLPLQSSPRVPR